MFQSLIEDRGKYFQQLFIKRKILKEKFKIRKFSI